MEWFRQTFDDSYLLLYSHRGRAEACQQVDFAMQVLELRPGDTVLDLACGAGRHAAEFTRRGIRTVALDLSPHLLRFAQTALQGPDTPTPICGICLLSGPSMLRFLFLQASDISGGHGRIGVFCAKYASL